MIIKKSELQEALAIVKPGLSSKEIIEQSTSFAFLKGKVITYNDEISISHPVTALDITGAIRAEELYQLLGKIKSEEIDIEIKESEILIKAGRVKAGLTLQQEILLPLDEIGSVDFWKKVPTNFCKHLRFAAPCCSTDSSKPLLTCVHVTESGTIEASDGYRLITCTLNKEMPTKEFLLPSSAAMHVIKLDPTHIVLGSGWVHFKKNETVLSCRIFEDAYPDISNHLKSKGTEVAFPKTLDEILERASIFSKREHILDEEVEICLLENKIKVKGRSEGGWFEESVKVAYTGEELHMRITPYLLQNILKETLVGTVNDRKIMFKGEDWKYVAMLRIKSN